MTPQSTAAKAEAAAEKHSDAWIPTEEGEMIEGTIVDVTAAWSDQKNADYPLLTICQDDGTEKKVHCFSTVLYNEALRQRPVPGERISITYLGVGEAKVRGRSGAKRYRFRIEGRSAEQIGSLYDRMDNQGGRGNRTGGQAPQSQARSGPAEPDEDEDEIPF